MATTPLPPPERLVREYLHECKLARKAETTRYRYRLLLERFLVFCQDWETHPAEADRRLLKHFQMDMDQLDPKTIQNRLTILSRFYDWMIREEISSTNPVRQLQRPKQAQRLAVYPTPEEAEKIEQAVQLRPYWVQVALKVLMTTGLRISELCALRKDDIRQQKTADDQCYSVLRVIGKGNKEREIPIHDDLRAELENLQEFWKDANLVTHWLFPSPKSPTEPVRARQLQRHLTRICDDAGVRHFSPHKLRHYCGTDLYKKSHDPFLVAKLLGHANVQTTTIYAHVETSDLAKRMGVVPPTSRETHDATNPAE
jgi:site-specific recombinase XerD